MTPRSSLSTNQVIILERRAEALYQLLDSTNPGFYDAAVRMCQTIGIDPVDLRQAKGRIPETEYFKTAQKLSNSPGDVPALLLLLTSPPVGTVSEGPKKARGRSQKIGPAQGPWKLTSKLSNWDWLGLKKPAPKNDPSMAWFREQASFTRGEARKKDLSWRCTEEAISGYRYILDCAVTLAFNPPFPAVYVKWIESYVSKFNALAWSSVQELGPRGGRLHSHLTIYTNELPFSPSDPMILLSSGDGMGKSIRNFESLWTHGMSTAYPMRTGPADIWATVHGFKWPYDFKRQKQVQASNPFSRWHYSGKHSAKGIRNELPGGYPIVFHSLEFGVARLKAMMEACPPELLPAARFLNYLPALARFLRMQAPDRYSLDIEDVGGLPVHLVKYYADKIIKRKQIEADPASYLSRERLPSIYCQISEAINDPDYVPRHHYDDSSSIKKPNIEIGRYPLPDFVDEFCRAYARDSIAEHKFFQDSAPVRDAFLDFFGQLPNWQLLLDLYDYLQPINHPNNPPSRQMPVHHPSDRYVPENPVNKSPYRKSK